MPTTAAAATTCLLNTIPSITILLVQSDLCIPVTRMSYLAGRMSTQTTVPTCFQAFVLSFTLTSDPVIYDDKSFDPPFFRRSITTLNYLLAPENIHS